MLSRRTILMLTLLAGAFMAQPVMAEDGPAFSARAFADAQKAGKPILVVIHAPWCPTCKAQTPILGALRADPKFTNLSYFVIDFDRQKDLLKQFGARMQSTLIAFKGDKEVGRSVGATDRTSIAALLNKTL